MRDGQVSKRCIQQANRGHVIHEPRTRIGQFVSVVLAVRDQVLNQHHEALVAFLC